MRRPWPTGGCHKKKLNRCSPISVIPPALYTHPHVQITFIRRTSRWNLEIWKQSNATSFVGEHWTEQYFQAVREGADKSLARHTSRCRRTKSIVSLERGVCSCAELQVFSCYRGWKEAFQATRVISTTSRRELSLSPPPQGKAHEEIHAIPTETLGKHAPSYATVKNWVAQFRWWFFHLCCASSWTTQNSDHSGDYWSNSRNNLGRPPDFG